VCVVPGRDGVRRPGEVLADRKLGRLVVLEVPGFCVLRHLVLLRVDSIDEDHPRSRP
jgi:hypothetical protein